MRDVRPAPRTDADADLHARPVHQLRGRALLLHAALVLAGVHLRQVRRVHRTGLLQRGRAPASVPTPQGTPNPYPRARRDTTTGAALPTTTPAPHTCSSPTANPPTCRGSPTTTPLPTMTQQLPMRNPGTPRISHILGNLTPSPTSSMSLPPTHPRFPSPGCDPQ